MKIKQRCTKSSQFSHNIPYRFPETYQHRNTSSILADSESNVEKSLVEEETTCRTKCEFMIKAKPCLKSFNFSLEQQRSSSYLCEPNCLTEPADDNLDVLTSLFQMKSQLKSLSKKLLSNKEFIIQIDRENEDLSKKKTRLEHRLHTKFTNLKKNRNWFNWC